MHTLSASADKLVIGYPWWFWLGLMLVGVGFFGALLRGEFKSAARAISAPFFGLALLGAGFYFFGWKTTFDDTFVRAYEPFRSDRRIAWSAVTNTESFQRAVGRRQQNVATFILIQGSGSESLEVPITGLSTEEVQRVLDFIEKRTSK